MDTQPGMQNPESKIESQKTEAPKTEPAKTEVVKEIHHHHHDNSRGPGSMFVGLIVVAVGVYFLGKQAGWFPADVSINWNWIWPLFIIFLGFSMLSRRGPLSWIVSGIMTLVVLCVLAALAFGTMPANRSTTTDPIAISKDAKATGANVQVTTGASKLTITGGSSQLVSGTYTHTGLQLEQTNVLSGTTQDVTLRTIGSWQWFGMHRNDLDLQLASDLPLRLTVDSGASDMNLNLANVMAQGVTVDTGASSLVLNLGDKVDQSDVKVKAGASSITVSLPKTVGAKVTIDSGATSKNLADFTKLDNKTYETSNYSSATKKVSLDFDLGAASLTVNWR